MYDNLDTPTAPSATTTSTITVIDPPRIDVVVPAFNEARRIGATLDALSGTFVRAGVAARILVVDNASVDDTVDQVNRTLGNHAVTIELINCRERGKGAAVRAGVRHVTAPYVAYLDADQSTPPENLLTGLALLDHGWDAVVASRRALGGRYVVPQPPLRRVGSRAFNISAARLVGPMRDTQCGLKMFRTAAIRPLVAAGRIDGFAFDVELLARVRAAGLRAMELPVEWSDDAAGSTFHPLRDGIQAFRELTRVRHAVRSAVRP